MTREQQIPLFLWVATALVVHALGGGGATEVVQVLEERVDIREFAGSVGKNARMSSQPLEIGLLEDEDDDEAEPEESEEEAPTEESARPVPASSLPEVSPKTLEPEPAKPEEKAPAVEPAPSDPAKQQLQMIDPRRVSVQQHVADKNQEDNANAKFAAEDANHVDEETQARITSTDQNDPSPTAAGNFQGAEKDPGDSDAQKIAQSEKSAGDPDKTPGATNSTATEERVAQEARARSEEKAAAQAQQKPAGAAPQEQVASKAQTASPDLHHHDSGTFSVQKAAEARAAAEARKGVQQSKAPLSEMLGYGKSGTTRSGVNLNLSHAAAQSIVGADKIEAMKKQAGERRLSQHRGSFQNLGVEKWRSSLENYVASVKPGNQTALNTARVPFAAYLNQIHQQLHEIFADGFLGSIEGLPANHPLSNQDMSTHLEIALNREDGRIVRMGITKSSGVTMFDVGALEAVKKAAPYGVPPGSIVSSDGNVYLHWEFHRRRTFACSTYFARPFILNVDQKTAPPSVEPAPRPNHDAPPAGPRSGSLAPPPAQDERKHPRAKSRG